VQKPPAITPDYFSEVLLPEIRELATSFDALRLSDLKEALHSLSEKEFISRVLVPLLQKMGYTGVATGSHGPGEFGVDIGPFFQIGDFGERTYYGVQAKACDITANASHAANISAIFNQADAAFTKRFPDADNLPRKLDRLFVITSGGITADAKALLLDYVQNHPGVMFLTGDRVLELLSKHGLLGVLRAEQQVKCVRIVPFLLPHSRGRKLSWQDCLTILLREHMEIESDLAHRLIDQIMQRERIMSTTIGKGFALPHTYNTGIGRHEIMLCGADGRFRWTHVQPTRVDFAAVCLFDNSESDVTGEIRRVVTSAAATHMTRTRAPAQPAERLLDLTSHIEQALKGASFEVVVVEPRAIRVGVRSGNS
jgi:mannitol/fructose-specific phosphotransferase system IIA component